MKIAIVGAGIIGVTTAWELAADGHEVTVFDRRSAAAEESSFAHTGLVAPAEIRPWSPPGMRGRVLQSVFAGDGDVQLRSPLSAGDRAWLRQWRQAGRPDNHLQALSRLQRLAAYSKARLDEIAAERELSYERSEGCLILLRSKREQKQVLAGLEALRETGTAHRQIDADEARRIEPALSTDTDLAGAIHLPAAEVGNCRQFALLLKREAEALGVQFFFDCDIAPLSAAAPGSLRLARGSEAVAYEAVVVCAGADSGTLLHPLGVRLPMAAVYGYSISATIREPLNAPRSAVLDERFRVCISRMGQRLRVAGVAEVGGVPSAQHPGSLQTLYKVLHDWFPGGAQLDSGVQRWKGARPMLPDGLPLMGPSGVPGVWLNLGHGSSGWALSCGSARVVADMVAGRPSDIDPDGLGLERLPQS